VVLMRKTASSTRPHWSSQVRDNLIDANLGVESSNEKYFTLRPGKCYAAIGSRKTTTGFGARQIIVNSRSHFPSAIKGLRRLPSSCSLVFDAQQPACQNMTFPSRSAFFFPQKPTPLGR
jgi:hypothetical protein